MDIKHKINRIDFLFHQFILFKENEHEKELTKILEDLITEMANNFDEKEQIIRLELLNMCDKYDFNFFAMMVILIGKYLNSFELKNISQSYKFKFDNYDIEIYRSISMSIMEKSFEKNNKIRLLDYEIEYELKELEKKSLLFLTLDLFTEVTKKINIDDNDIRVLYYNAALIRKLSIDLGRLDHFYFALAVMIDRFTNSQQFQLARDLAEEALIISRMDKLLYWGYFLQFRVFNSQFIPTEASLYLLCCLINSNKYTLSSEFFISLLINVHRFFRNTKLVPYAESIYKTIKEFPSLSEFDLESITCSHFNLRIIFRKEELIVEIYNFLNAHRESIINSEKISAVPWLNLLYSCFYVYKDHPNLSLLKHYIIIFESIVGKEDSERLKIYSLSDSEKIVDYFIESLVAHEGTRDKNDLKGEVRNSLVLASKLISYSYKNNNANAFLLAMILKSDYSLVFEDKDIVSPLREIHTIQKDQEKVSSYYSYYIKVKEILSRFPETEFLWLASTNEGIYFLRFNDGNFKKIEQITKYTLGEQKKWLQEKTSLLAFNDTIKIADQIYSYPEEDQEKDMNELINSLQFTKIESSKNRSVCIFRDIELSELPHNLLLNSDNRFVLEYGSITDTISFELFKGFNFNFNISPNPKIAMWLPTEDGDFAINYLASKLENTITNYDIELITSSLPIKPIKSNVTILVAHGDKKISGFPSFYTFPEKAITNFERIVEETDILILFVCYSGSSERATLKSNLNSLVRKLLAKGIKTIIAPFWSLHISVPPIWLPVFLDSLLNGKSVSDAFQVANMVVFSINKNPGAWCCLHCYGNPFIKLLRVIEK
ncbi:MAG TPA: hypothetical protein DHV28_03960 [Ignavibacteriales bacterium]|nr:hypothetical protein [Ignavibacteriales bacterium]